MYMNDSEKACELEEGPNCDSSPVSDYVWLLKRVGHKLRTLVTR